MKLISKKIDLYHDFFLMGPLNGKGNLTICINYSI